MMEPKQHWEPHRERGNHLFFFLFLFKVIIFFKLNDKSMEKEPVRVLTPF